MCEDAFCESASRYEKMMPSIQDIYPHRYPSFLIHESQKLTINKNVLTFGWKFKIEQDIVAGDRDNSFSSKSRLLLSHTRTTRAS